MEGERGGKQSSPLLQCYFEHCQWGYPKTFFWLRPWEPQRFLVYCHCVSKNASTLKRYSSKLYGSILIITQKLKHANSILEYFEYYCQMSSKSILIISSYTVSKSTRFQRHSVDSAADCADDAVSSGGSGATRPPKKWGCNALKSTALVVSQAAHPYQVSPSVETKTCSQQNDTFSLCERRFLYILLCLLVDIFNKILRIKCQSCSYQPTQHLQYSFI